MRHNRRGCTPAPQGERESSAATTRYARQPGASVGDRLGDLCANGRSCNTLTHRPGVAFLAPDILLGVEQPIKRCQEVSSERRRRLRGEPWQTLDPTVCHRLGQLTGEAHAGTPEFWTMRRPSISAYQRRASGDRVAYH